MKKTIYRVLVILIFAANSCENAPKQFHTETRSNWNGRTINGKVKNMTNDRISFVQVDFDILNDNNHVIKTVSASSDNGIEANGEWEFKIEAVAAGTRITRLTRTVTR